MELQCPSCNATYDVPKTALSEEGTAVKCPECGHTYTALPSGVTLAEEGIVSSNTSNRETEGDDAPFISGHSNGDEEEVEVSPETREKVQQALEQPNLSPLEKELDRRQEPVLVEKALVEALEELEQESQEELLRKASKEGYPSIAEVLVDAGVDPDAADDRERTALHHAAEADAAEVMEILLDTWSDLEARDEREKTPLHLAVVGDSTAHSCSERVIPMLLDAGADPKVEVDTGHSPLHHAARKGAVQTVRDLVEAGADPEARTNTGTTPLHSAIFPGGYTEVVRILLDEGANPNAMVSNGKTPLHEAADQDEPEIVRLLLEAGADPAATDNRDRTPSDLASGETTRILQNHT